MTILQLKNISKSYRSGGYFTRSNTVQVLRSVSLTINAGEFVGLVGRSGSGKSTLGRIALGIERPDNGEVFFHGQKITGHRLSPVLRRTIQVVFQNGESSCNPRWTAERILAEPLRNFTRSGSDEISRQVDRLLEQVGLVPADGKKYPGHFSGGQIQRVCIARALAAEPDLIILDESVSSLDMIVQARILALLERLRRETGMAFLLITHDLRLIRRFCSKAFVLDRGSLEPFSIHLTPPLPKPVRELADALPPTLPSGCQPRFCQTG